MTSKHLGPDTASRKVEDDLESNPGIGQSKGLFARAGTREADLIEGDSTAQGDIENDSGRGGGVNPKLGRTNK